MDAATSARALNASENNNSEIRTRADRFLFGMLFLYVRNDFDQAQVWVWFVRVAQELRSPEGNVSLCGLSQPLYEVSSMRRGVTM